MSTIKVQYIFRDLVSLEIVKFVFTIDDIEKNESGILHLLKNKYVELIARRSYTGLTDRNGFEIYEGDIVTYSATKFMVVVYQAPKFVMKEKIKKGFSKCWTEFILSPELNQFEEVIGNIYENPELLNGATK